MIYNCVAFPSRFAEWCELLLLELVTAAKARELSSRRGRSRSRPEEAKPEVALIFGDSLAELGRQLMLTNSQHFVAVSRQPHSDTCQVLRDGQRPFLVVLDEPVSAVETLMRDHQFGYLQAARMLANSSASLLQFVGMANALVLRPDPVPDFGATARLIERHFHFDFTKTAIEEIVNRPILAELAARIETTTAALTIEPPLHATELSVVSAAASELVAEDPFMEHRPPSILEGAIVPLWRALQGEDIDEIVWGRDLFFSGDRPGEAATLPFNLTGPSRCLSFGPYLRLPGGPWSCRVVFACNEKAIGTRMMADAACAGVALGHAQFQLAEAGIFEIEFAFDNANPDRPIEVRLFNMNAALDGHFALGEVRLSPLEFKRLPVTQ